MGEEITTQFRAEGEPAFSAADKGEGTPPAPSTGESTDSNPTPSSEGGTNPDAGKKEGGDAGFLDHPRWKEREADWNKRFNDQETRHVNEMQKLREDMEKLRGPAAPQPVPNDAPVQVPGWFGGDDKQWKEFLDWNRSLAAEVVKSDRAQLDAKQQEQQKQIDAATTWFEETVASLESNKDLNPKGEKVDRNKLLKFTMENELVDTQGRWNYKAAYQLMQAKEAANPTKAAAVQDRKELAAATTSGSKRGEEKASAHATSETFRQPGKRPW